MKSVYYNHEKREEGQKKHKHLIFSTKERAIEQVHMSDITYDYPVWGLLCDEETFNYIKEREKFGVFIPNEEQRKELRNMHFYKEVILSDM